MKSPRVVKRASGTEIPCARCNGMYVYLLYIGGFKSPHQVEVLEDSICLGCYVEVSILEYPY